MTPEKLFFIYVAKSNEWQKLQEQDWDYVASMGRFFKWWMKRYFNVELTVEADILPVIPGKLFDRMSIAYLIRDHQERGTDVFHFYLAYFKPLWTDCNTEGYTAKNLGITWWQRIPGGKPEAERMELFVDKNCPRASHILTHEMLRLKGRTKKQFFGKVHELWDKHIHGGLPLLYFDSQFRKVSKQSSHKFATLDPTELSQ